MLKSILFLFAILGLTSLIPGIYGSNRRQIPHSCLKAMYKAALDRTNMYRQRHHAQKLVEDASIAKTAIAWANSMSDKGSFEHNIHEIRKLGYGENIAWRGSSAVLSMSPTSCAEYANKMIDDFYIEVKDASYNYATGKARPGKKIGHFTQLVWTDTSRVGHGFAFSARPINGFYRVYLVADYKGPGNVNCPSGCVSHVKRP